MGSGRRIGSGLMLACALGLALTLAATGTAQADGAFYGGAEEPAQEAVILFHGSTEELTLRVAYRGAEGDFGWVVPLPSEPVIEEAGAEVFEYLEGNYGVMSLFSRVLAGGELKQEAGPGVEVLEERRVGIYDTTVLRATDPGGLAAWLGERGYAYGPEQAELFRSYTDRGWCFVAFRVVPGAAEAPRPDLVGPGTAYLQPLRFTFTTPQAVFPLRLTSGNPSASAVRLYVFGDETYGCELVPDRLTYALSPGELDGLRRYLPALGTPVYGGAGTCLTVLERVFSTEEMTDDLVLLPDAAPVAQPEGLPFFGLAQDTHADQARRPGRLAVLLALAILVLSLAAVPILLRSRTQSNAWRLFTGLCATFVTMAVVATLAMAILYRQDQERAGSTEWKDLGVGQPAVYTRTEVVPGPGGSVEEMGTLRLFAGLIMPDGSLEEAEVSGPGSSSGWGCALSPDGRHAALLRGGTLTVLVLGEGGRLEGRCEISDVIMADMTSAQPWSPEGKQLAFLAYQGDPYAIMVYDVETGSIRKMGGEAGGLQYFSWSEDGRFIISTRVVGAGTDEMSSAVDIIDADSGSVAGTVTLPARPERAALPSSFWLVDGRLVVLRGLNLAGWEQAYTGLELGLYDIETGEELETLKLREPLTPLSVRAVGDDELVLLGLGRSEETGGWAWKKYTVDLEGLRTKEKLERSLGREVGEADLLDVVTAGMGPLEQRTSLDGSGRYLLIKTLGNRTVLADLAEGDVSVISGMSAGWVVAR